MTTHNEHPLTIPAIRAIKVRDGAAPLVMVTAYDAPTAQLAAAAGVDLILVGDSLGTAILGYDSTVPVTLDDMLHHLKAARRGAPDAHIIVDLPFGSFQESDAQAISSAVRLMQQGGADAVKLEGGRRMANRVRALTDAGIPVVGHVGLTPQTAGMLGGYKVQGRDLATARAVIDDAKAIAGAGAYCLVVEVVPSLIGQRITEQVDIPVIGIGAGPATDGQVLVWTDLAGLTAGHKPRFVHAYADLAGNLHEAFAQFASEVRSGAYPKPEHEYGTPKALIDTLEAGE
jgi:3-methyl-2-oxobutanoate hydroxymethyltransferase